MRVSKFAWRRIEIGLAYKLFRTTVYECGTERRRF
jgi:hypothetical protein